MILLAARYIKNSSCMQVESTPKTPQPWVDSVLPSASSNSPPHFPRSHATRLDATTAYYLPPLHMPALSTTINAVLCASSLVLNMIRNRVPRKTGNQGNSVLLLQKWSAGRRASPSLLPPRIVRRRYMPMDRWRRNLEARLVLPRVPLPPT